jgi:SSS family solute:Na+ symporter
MLLLDWIVLGAFVLALVAFIVVSMRTKDKTSTDYFLAGRDATWDFCIQHRV